ncbi:hypothetical protein HPB50_016867 [Hyalomma asiaticum]|uniref:Uncharacterized protein n=1 Tax=Hyalomma asiaticum TaxID=266040 RepID=A0ACB7S1P7_HYAAI|nr:hypothetical protein HPB50_016867 [Hyalomma asiaticum]
MPGICSPLGDDGRSPPPPPWKSTRTSRKGKSRLARSGQGASVVAVVVNKLRVTHFVCVSLYTLTLLNAVNAGCRWCKILPNYSRNAGSFSRERRRVTIGAGLAKSSLIGGVT